MAAETPPRSRMREELVLILPALFIALVVWVIARQAQLDTDSVVVPVTVTNAPPNMQITQEPEEVRVTVQFPQELRNQVVGRNFTLGIDANEVFRTEPGEWAQGDGRQREVIRLEPRDVLHPGLSSTVRVIQVSPPQVELTAYLITVTAEIAVVTTGTLPTNMELSAPPRPDPATVRVTGTPEALARLAEQGNKIPTAPINLAQMQTSGQVFPNLVVAEGLELLNRNARLVTVDIALTERPVRRVYSGMQVLVYAFDETLEALVRPATVDVELEGPDSALAQIESADIEVYPVRDPEEVVGQRQELGLEARLKDPTGTAGRQVRVVQVTPNRVTVEYIPATGQNSPPAASVPESSDSGTTRAR